MATDPIKVKKQKRNKKKTVKELVNYIKENKN